MQENQVFWLVIWGSFIFITLFSISVGCFLAYKKSMLKVNTQLRHMEEGAIQKEFEKIRQRLAVLEKIVTDKNYDLKEELASLKPAEDNHAG